MRKLARSIARFNMKKEGIHQPNRKDKNGNSFFSLHWREYMKGVK